MGSEDAKDMMHSGGDLLSAMQDTEEFLDLLSELLSYLQKLVAYSEARITLNEAEQEMYRRGQAEEREIIMDKVRATLNTLAANDLWTHLVQQGRKLAEQAKEVTQDTAHASKVAMEDAAPRMQSNLLRVLNSQEMVNFTETLKMFLQRIVGDGHDVTPLFEYTKAALNDIIHDQELHKAIHEVDDALHNVTEGEEYAHTQPLAHGQHAYDPAHSLTHHTHIHVDPELAKQQLKRTADHLEAALHHMMNNTNLRRAREEAHVLRHAFLNDPDNVQLMADARKLWRDLHSPEGGLDPTLLQGLRHAIVPIIMERLNDIPIPPITGTVSALGKMMYTVEGIHISVPEILPNNVHMKFEYEMDTVLDSLSVNNQHLYLYIELKNIQVHLRNVAWAYQRLSKPIKSDSGHLQLDTLGQGIGVRLRVQVHNSSIDVRECHVSIQQFAAHVTDSRHNKLYEKLTHVFARKIRRALEENIEKKLTAMGPTVGSQIMTTVNKARSTATGFAQSGLARKTQVLEMLRARRGERSADHDRNVREKVQKIRGNHLFQSTVHHGAQKAQNMISQAQERVDEKRDMAHERNMVEAQIANANAYASGLAPTLPNTARPLSPPVPAMTFIPVGAIDTAPIAQGLQHVNLQGPDTRTITNQLHHVQDPAQVRNEQILQGVAQQRF